MNHLHLVGETPADATWDLGVECEHCGRRERALPGQTIEGLREDLAMAGWFSHGDIDSCPTCRKDVLA